MKTAISRYLRNTDHLQKCPGDRRKPESLLQLCLNSEARTTRFRFCRMSSKQCVLAVFAVFPNLVGSQRAKYRAKIKNKKITCIQFIELPLFQFLGSYD